MWSFDWLNLLEKSASRHLVRFLFGLTSLAAEALLSQIFQKYQDLDSTSISKTSSTAQQLNMEALT